MKLVGWLDLRSTSSTHPLLHHLRSTLLQCFSHQSFLIALYPDLFVTPHAVFLYYLSSYFLHSSFFRSFNHSSFFLLPAASSSIHSINLLYRPFCSLPPARIAYFFSALSVFFLTFPIYTSLEKRLDISHRSLTNHAFPLPPATLIRFNASAHQAIYPQIKMFSVLASKQLVLPNHISKLAN